MNVKLYSTFYYSHHNANYTYRPANQLSSGNRYYVILSYHIKKQAEKITATDSQTVVGVDEASPIDSALMVTLG